MSPVRHQPFRALCLTLDGAQRPHHALGWFQLSCAGALARQEVPLGRRPGQVRVQDPRARHLGPGEPLDFGDPLSFRSLTRLMSFTGRLRTLDPRKLPRALLRRLDQRPERVRPLLLVLQSRQHTDIIFILPATASPPGPVSLETTTVRRSRRPAVRSIADISRTDGFPGADTSLVTVSIRSATCHGPDEPADAPLPSQHEWFKANIQDIGPLGKHFPNFAYIAEGDSSSFMGLIPNGLNGASGPRPSGKRR